MQTEREGEQAFFLHNKIIENEKQRRELLLENIKFLTEVYNKKLYKAVLGDEKAPWSAYLGQFETYYSKQKVFSFIQIYNKFVNELGLDSKILAEFPYSKLGLLVSVVNKENVNEWLEKARELTNQDFQDELRIAQGKKSYLDCEHEDMRKYEICQTCNFRHKQDEVEK